MGFPGKSPVRCAVTMVRSPGFRRQHIGMIGTCAAFRAARSRMELYPRYRGRLIAADGVSAKQAATVRRPSVLAAANIP